MVDSLLATRLFLCPALIVMLLFMSFLWRKETIVSTDGWGRRQRQT
jgi:hypothetical protein